MLYFDYAAATPLLEAVEAAMRPLWRERFYNPSATYLPAVSVHQELEAARARVAHWLGARPNEIIFTAGATEANNLAIHGIMQAQPDANIVVSAIEHEAVLAPAGRYDRRMVPVPETGIVDPEAVAGLIDDRTVLVSVMYANNEIGTVQPLRRIGEKIRMIRAGRQASGNRTPLYFHTDAAQAGNYLDLHVDRLGVDLLTLNGGKIYGPKQTGVLYVSHHISLQPYLLGGGQERGLRSGTENVAGSIGLAAALDIVQQDRQHEANRMNGLQSQLLYELRQRLPDLNFTGTFKTRLPNNLHLTVPGYDNERLILELEKRDILVAAGSACSASSGEPSHVLKAIGLTDSEARSSIRITLGRPTSRQDITVLVNNLQAILANNRESD